MEKTKQPHCESVELPKGLTELLSGQIPDPWKKFEDVNFLDETIHQFFIDTRDFGTNCIKDKFKNKTDDKIDVKTICKYPHFLHTREEVKLIVERFYQESGGPGKWRYLDLEGDTQGNCDGWQMKYIRIYVFEQGVVVCNSHNRALRKEWLRNKVAQKYLNHH